MSLPHLHTFLAHVKRECCAFSIKARVSEELDFALKAVNPEHAQVRPDARGHAAVFDRIDRIAREPELRGHIFLAKLAAYAGGAQPRTERPEHRRDILRD